jgi:hypothetical protein
MTALIFDGIIMRRGSDDMNIIENVETFIRTFHKGDYDVEFDNALSSDRGVTLPARPTQTLYDKPDNWVGRNRIGLERVKRQLQRCIESETDDQSFVLELRHNDGWGYLRDNEEPIVWHESILDCYWDQLGAKIGRNQPDRVTDINCICIENIEIKKGLAALVAILQNGRSTISSRAVKLINTNLCEEGIVWVSKLVDISLELRYLDLHHNRIDDIDSAYRLSRSIKSHTRINTLNLNHCDLGSNPEILSVILQSDASCTDLRHNNIDSLGAVKIAEYLEGNPPIHSIGIDHNQLNDDDALLISHALKRNTNMHLIQLHSNKITSIGVKVLLTCVFDGSSLNAISESNHTLTGMNIFNYINQPIKRLDHCIKKLLRMGRNQKICLALNDMDSLLQYLANVPMELIPEVLAFPLRLADDPYRWVVDQAQHKHLNIVYCTMRWWNMPMLNSYHQSCVNSDIKRKMDD